MFGASLVFMKWIKAFENGTDYSLMKTARSALFLITSREEKYKAQAAIETFFVRGGDTVTRPGRLVRDDRPGPLDRGVRRRSTSSAILVWIVLCVLIFREYRRGRQPESPPRPRRAIEIRPPPPL